MSITIKPKGEKLIVRPLKSEESETDAGIKIMDFQIERAEVVEISDFWQGKYNVGDIVIFSEGGGLSLPNYKKKACLWLDGRSPGDGGDVWGILTEDK